jgi:hypothetical protein
MRGKDLRVEMRDISTHDKPNQCKITIFNDGGSIIEAPEFRINTEGKWKIEAVDNVSVISKPGAELFCGVFSDKKSIPAQGHQEFIVTSSPALAKDNYPRDFYLGFNFGFNISDPFVVNTSWESKPADDAQYASATIKLTNHLATLEDPLFTFETVSGENLTDSGSDVDIDPSGHGVVNVDDNHQLHFMELSGGSPKNKFVTGDRIIKLGVNRGSYPVSKQLELPVKPWVGFEINVAFIAC